MKKQLSIKARITLWFAVFMVLLAALALVFLLLSGNTLLRRDAESVLTETVEHNAANLVYTDGQLSLGEQFQFYTNGVYTVIYDRNGVYLAGQVPVGVAVGEPLAEGAARPINAGGEAYYLYDRKVVLADGNHLWLRGIALKEGTVNIVGVVARLALAALPFFVFFAVGRRKILAHPARAPQETLFRAAATKN